ncbi:MAG: WD40 repeat domain-containing protein [Planctomycetota bacterium]|nr:WD40 repeat domain-containing protein [Planctomycetota bacterium]
MIDENGVAGNNNLAHLMVYDMQKQSVVSKVSKSLAYLNGCDCEVSPNGKRLARIERLHILIWDAATAEELHRIDTIKPDHPGKLQYIEFAGPDRLVSFHGEETVRLYDVQSGKKLNEFQLIFPLKGLGGHPGRKMRVSPGGQFLAILHIRNEAPQKRVLRLHVYDLKSGEHVGNPPIAENLNRLAVQDLVFSDDGEEVAALLYQQRERDFVIVSWNMKQGRQSGFYGPFPSIQTRPFTKERHLVWLKDKSGWVHSGHQLVLRETGKETEIGDPDQGIRHDAQIIGPNTMLQFWETKPRRTARNEMVPVVVKW